LSVQYTLTEYLNEQHAQFGGNNSEVVVLLDICNEKAEDLEKFNENSFDLSLPERRTAVFLFVNSLFVTLFLLFNSRPFV